MLHIERSKFGGVERRHKRLDDDAPVSRSDLSKGSQELIKYPDVHVNWTILLISSLVIMTFSAWAIFMPEQARLTMKLTVDWIASNLGWYYVLTMALVIGFVVWVACSKEGNVRLGPDHSRPQYKLGTWVAMLFAAGVGIDLLFFSVTGPVVQYLYPPLGEGETQAALQDAVVWTMFHYGIAGWSVYALLGMSMGYFAYRWGMPLSIRAALYSLLGKRVSGPLGDGISIIALVGTVFGVATTMGIGVVLLNVGFARIFGLEEGLSLQIALVIGAVILTIAATTSGVDRGIRWISELNLWSAVAMMAYILIAGQTAFLLNGLVENIGQFLVTLPSRMLQTLVYVPGSSEWMGGWTLFFWAILTAVLTVAMLLAGGVLTMEYATLIFALPVTIIAYLVMASFYKVLRMERAEREGQVLRRPSIAPSGGPVPERSWRQRLGQLLTYPSRREVSQFLERIVRPALDEVAIEFRKEGYEVERSNIANATGIEGPLLRVDMDELRAFHYQVSIVEAPVPTFSGKISVDTDVYYRLEVFTQTGSGGYDLFGLTKQQVINDVLERYEAHLAFLTLSAETDTASVLTPPVAAPEPPVEGNNTGN